MSTKLGDLRKVHFDFIHSLVTEDVDVDEILKKHGIGKNTFHRWLGDELFMSRFNEAVARQSAMLITRNRPIAAKKLAKLIDSKSEETSRKACLDVIGLASLERMETADSGDGMSGAVDLSDAEASKILKALAKD